MRHGRRWLPLTAGALLALGGGAWLVARLSRPDYAAVDADALRDEIATLTSSRDSLRALAVARIDADPLLRRRPDGDVAVALPAPFVQGLVQDIIAGWFHEVELHFGNLRVAKAGEVRARLGIFGRRQVGRYALRLHLDDVRGRLEPGPPVLRFADDTIGLAVPVRLMGGEGRGTIAFDWDSRGVANAVCGDLAAERRIEGTVRPADYVARGRLRLLTRGDTVLVDPAFPALSLRLFVQPSRRSVAMLQALLESKGRLCDVALEKAQVEQRLLELVGRGFTVRVPQRFFRPVRLPFAIDTAVSLPDRAVRLTVSPAATVVSPAGIWLGARVDVARASAPAEPGGTAGPAGPARGTPP
jgi:hypothetical protein